MAYSKRLNKMKWIKLFEGFINNEKGVNLANIIFDKYRSGIWRDYAKEDLEAIEWKEIETLTHIYIYTTLQNRYNWLAFVYVKSSKELLWYIGQPILEEIDEKADFYLSDMKLKTKRKGFPHISFRNFDNWKLLISDFFSKRYPIKYCRRKEFRELETAMMRMEYLLKTRSIVGHQSGIRIFW